MIVSDRHSCIMAMKVREDVKEFLLSLSDAHYMSCMSLLDLLSVFPAPSEVNLLITILRNDKYNENEVSVLRLLARFVLIVVKYIIENLDRNLSNSDFVVFLEKENGIFLDEDDKKLFYRFSGCYFSPCRIENIFGEN